MGTFLVVRVIHILCGAFWMGSAVVAGWYLIPAALETGPDGAKVMAALERRGFMTIIPIIAGIGVVSGLYLYWRYTAGFSAEISRTHPAMAYGTGGALAIVSMILGGSLVGRNLKNAGALTQKAMTMPEGAERAGVLAKAAGLRARALLFARLVSILLVATVMLMSAAVFI